MRTAAALKALLGAQIAVGLLVVVGDVGDGLSGLSFGPPAPRLEMPARPGDQTRRYRPRDVPGTPGLPDASDMPSRLVAVPDGEVLRLTGQIAPGDGARIADRLGEEGTPLRIQLHSPGGSVRDALEIGRALRAGGFATEVTADEVCLSACPYIFAGGVARVAADDAIIGVHQHSFGENQVLPAFLAVEDVQRGQGEVLAYLDEMGVDLRIMGPALSTPADEIYVLLPEDLRDYGLLTDPT